MIPPFAPPHILWDINNKHYIYAGMAENGLPCYAPAQAELIPVNAPPAPPEPPVLFHKIPYDVQAHYVRGESE